jgi:REP element-mobilizing transposase RayT
MLCLDAQHTKHATYKLAYHFVWCPKYRKRILTGKMAAFVEQEIRRICEINTWTIGALYVREDHVHLFLSASPSVAPSQIAHILKGTTAHRVLQHFPARQETALGRCLLVSFVLRGHSWRYERCYRIKIYRGGTGLKQRETKDAKWTQPRRAAAHCNVDR